MSFAFLYPLVWLGGLALAAPLWLHLRRRVERNVVQFSALQFLEDQPMPQQSPLRLRDVLLLIMRILAVLLLLTAFAWPYNPVLLTEKPGESRVYILDNTLSHGANGGFVHNRDRLAEEIASTGPETQIAVIHLTAQPRVISQFGDSHQVAAGKVRALEASFQRGSYTAAFRQADALLVDALGKRRRILVYSDNQENQWAEMLNATAFLRGVELELSKTQDATPTNVALARPRVQRIFIGGDGMVDLAVELRHQGQLKTAAVTIEANGQKIMSQIVQLSGQSGQTVFNAQWQADPRDYLTGSVSVVSQPDVLAADNRVFFSLPPVREGRLMLLGDSPFLRAALSPEVMGGYWATQLIESVESAEQLSDGEIANVLCIESKYLISSGARSLVSRYLNSGRTVCLMVNHMSPVIRTFLRELGFEAEGVVSSTPTSTFRYVFADHPIFRPFRSLDFGDLMDISVRRYHRLKAARAVPLIFSQSGDALLYQATNTKGTLLVSAFGFESSETSWPFHTTFVPFLDLCFQNAREDAGAVTTFEPGDTFVKNISSEKPVKEFMLIEDGQELLRGHVENSRVKFTIPDKPGCYTLRYDTDAVAPLVLAINPSPLESDLTYLTSSEDIQQQLVDSTSDTVKSDPISEHARLTRSEILRQQIWWVALLAGLALLLGESTWLVARKERS